MGLGFIERMRATSAAERWVSHVKFPGVSLESANEASKLLVQTFVRGWTSNVESETLGVRAVFIAFSSGFVASLPSEVRDHPEITHTMKGLETAFYAGWGASARRRLGVRL